MKQLALDASTPTASLALLEDDALVLQTSWTAEQGHHENIVAHIADAVARAGWTWDVINQFVVGRGPGAYSGLRASLLAVQALAAPGGQPVVAFSSMEALALRLLDEHQTDTLTVVGDARRQTIWLATITRATLARGPAIWRLVPLDEAPEQLKAAHLIATPHTQTLTTLREAIHPTAWLPGDQLPTAADLACLARLRQAIGTAPEPLVPLYLHAAV